MDIHIIFFLFLHERYGVGTLQKRLDEAFLVSNHNIWFGGEIWQIKGLAQDCSTSNIFLKPLFRGSFDPFVNNANLGAIGCTSNGT